MTGDHLYAWQERDDKGWGMIAVASPVIGPPQPLVHRNAEIVERWRPIAQAHRRASGRPVRLARFTLDWSEDELE